MEVPATWPAVVKVARVCAITATGLATSRKTAQRPLAATSAKAQTTWPATASDLTTAATAATGSTGAGTAGIGAIGAIGAHEGT